MVVTTKAIVLSSIKYADSDLIVKCYTELGIKSFLVKRIFKQKKGKLTPAFFQPLTQLEITANYNSNRTLHFIQEASLNYAYTTISINVVKQTIVIFLSEILSKTMQEEEKNEQLFQYLETSLIWLDTNDEVSNFHLLFLLNLTKHLGFHPEKENIEYPFFSLEEGRFLNSIPKINFISGNNLRFFKLLLGINFEGLHELKLNGNERQTILDILLKYFELHLSGFNKPKSLAILKTVFE